MSQPVDVLDAELALRPLNQERRATVRYPVNMAACCHPQTRTHPVAWRAQVRDLSTLGLGLHFEHPVEVSTLLEVDLESAYRVVLQTVLARVVYVEADPHSGWMVGCAFTGELTDAELRLFQVERVRAPCADGRRWVRFPCNVETVCSTCETAPGQQVRARVLNISPGGIGLLLPCQFGPGTLLNFELPTLLGQPALHLLVRVVRAVAHGQGDWFVGCEFAQPLSTAQLAELLV